MKTNTYSHITMQEREIISVLKAEGHSMREIATKLGRSPSSISRELQRNSPPVYKDHYLPHRANQRAELRKSEAHQRPRLKDPRIRHYVHKKLQLGWSPEQIANNMNASLRISETVPLFPWKTAHVRAAAWPSAPRHNRF